MTFSALTGRGICRARVLTVPQGETMIRARFTVFGLTKEIARIEGYRTVDGCEIADVITRDGRRWPVPVVLIEQF